MPYKNIVFAKLEKRLLNDPRWYMMSEPGQLNYIRFILFATETYNKIPKNIEAIKKGFKTDQDLETVKNTIKEIRLNFPKFKENKHFYYFDSFEEKTNYIPKRAIPRKSQGLPKDGVDKDKEEDKEKKKIKTPKLPPEDLITSLKTNPVYKGIDIDTELGKMDAWLLIHPGRKKTPRFVLRWLNKIEKPLPATPQKIYKPKEWTPPVIAEPTKEQKEEIKGLVAGVVKKLKQPLIVR